MGMQILTVKAKINAKSKEAQALKDFELLVGTGGMADDDEYALYGIASDEPKALNHFYTAMLPFCQEAGMAETVEEVEECWKEGDALFCLKKIDFDVVTEEEVESCWQEEGVTFCLKKIDEV